MLRMNFLAGVALSLVAARKALLLPLLPPPPLQAWRPWRKPALPGWPVASTSLDSLVPTPRTPPQGMFIFCGGMGCINCAACYSCHARERMRRRRGRGRLAQEPGLAGGALLATPQA